VRKTEILSDFEQRPIEDERADLLARQATAEVRAAGKLATKPR
jgi:hypothetical protein